MTSIRFLYNANVMKLKILGLWRYIDKHTAKIIKFPNFSKWKQIHTQFDKVEK